VWQFLNVTHFASNLGISFIENKNISKREIKVCLNKVYTNVHSYIFLNSLKLQTIQCPPRGMMKKQKRGIMNR
jgi:hypothetical protein